MAAASEIRLAPISIVVAIALSHAFMYREPASVRERLAKLEGAIEEFFAGKPGP